MANFFEGVGRANPMKSVLEMTQINNESMKTAVMGEQLEKMRREREEYDKPILLTDLEKNIPPHLQPSMYKYAKVHGIVNKTPDGQGEWVKSGDFNKYMDWYFKTPFVMDEAGKDTYKMYKGEEDRLQSRLSLVDKAIATRYFNIRTKADKDGTIAEDLLAQDEDYNKMVNERKGLLDQIKQAKDMQMSGTMAIQYNKDRYKSLLQRYRAEDVDEYMLGHRGEKDMRPLKGDNYRNQFANLVDDSGGTHIVDMADPDERSAAENAGWKLPSVAIAGIGAKARVEASKNKGKDKPPAAVTTDVYKRKVAESILVENGIPVTDSNIDRYIEMRKQDDPGRVIRKMKGATSGMAGVKEATEGQNKGYKPVSGF